MTPFRLFTLLLLLAFAAAKQMCKSYFDPNYFDYRGVFSGYENSFIFRNNGTDLQFKIYFNLCEPLQTNKIIKDQGTFIGKGENTNLMVEDVTRHTFYQLSTSDTSLWTEDTNEIVKSVKPYKRTQEQLILSYKVGDGTAKELREATGLSVLFVRVLINCGKDDNNDFHDIIYLIGSKELALSYRGTKGCGKKVTKSETFLSKNITFTIILLGSSLACLFLGKNQERIVMSLTGVQLIIVMISKLFSLAYFNTEEYKEVELYWNMGALAVLFIVFGLSFFSQFIAYGLTIVTMGYILYTTLTFLAVIFLDMPYLRVYTLVAAFLLLAACLLKGQSVRQRYAYLIWTSIATPYFLTHIINIRLGMSFDLFGFNDYKQFGRQDKITLADCLYRLPQLIITSVLIFLKMRDYRKYRRDKDELLLNKLKPEDLDDDDPGAFRRVTERNNSEVNLISL